MQRFLLATLAFGLHAQTFTTLSGFNNGFNPVRIPAKEIAHSDLMSIKIEASSRWTVIC